MRERGKEGKGNLEGFCGGALLLVRCIKLWHLGGKGISGFVSVLWIGRVEDKFLKQCKILYDSNGPWS